MFKNKNNSFFNEYFLANIQLAEKYYERTLSLWEINFSEHSARGK
jgi:hypothetical protein